MKKIFFFACLCGVLLGFISCADSVSDEITIYGNIIDRTTGQPLYNVLIQEKNKVGGSTATGNDGNYEFTLPLKGSSDGKYYFVASKDKYSPSEYELKMSQVDKNRRVKVDFQLVKESITYTGTVLDTQNKPIFDAHIKAQFSEEDRSGDDYNIGTTTMTDINGVYTIELPRPHYYNRSTNEPLDQWKFAITATKSGYGGLTYILNQNADDMGEVITLNFVMGSNMVTVSGIVTNNSTGTPIQNAYLIVSYSSYGNYIGSTMTDSNGKYSILFAPRNSSYTYYFNMSKDGFDTNTQKLVLSSADAGESYTLNFSMTK